jgi:hypothetical protein
MPDFAAEFELHRYGIAYNAGMLMIPKRNESRGKFIRYRFFVMPATILPSPIQRILQ